MRVLPWMAGGVLVLAGAAGVPAAGTAATVRPDLSGKWRLDRELTERLRESARAEEPRGRGDGDFGRGPGTGTGRPRGGDDGDEGGGDAGGGDAGRPGGDWSAEGGTGGEHQRGLALQELTIVQSGDRVTITDGEGRVQVLTVNGEKVRDQEGRRGGVTRRAIWEKDGTLTVETTPEHGGKRTESYIVSNDRKHLYVTAGADRGGGHGRVLAYFAETDAPPAAAPPAAPAPNP